MVSSCLTVSATVFRANVYSVLICSKSIGLSVKYSIVNTYDIQIKFFFIIFAIDGPRGKFAQTPSYFFLLSLLPLNLFKFSATYAHLSPSKTATCCNRSWLRLILVLSLSLAHMYFDLFTLPWILGEIKCEMFLSYGDLYRCPSLFVKILENDNLLMSCQGLNFLE